jgi:hypothetical protein
MELTFKLLYSCRQVECQKYAKKTMMNVLTIDISSGIEYQINKSVEVTKKKIE